MTQMASFWKVLLTKLFIFSAKSIEYVGRAFNNNNNNNNNIYLFIYLFTAIGF